MVDPWNPRKQRSNRSPWFYLAVGILVIGSIQLWNGLSFNDNYLLSFSYQDRLEELGPIVARREENNGGAWLSSISGMNETTCPWAFQKMRSGEWQDPNEDKLLFRRMKNPPNLMVSVHNEEYDRVRFKSIYNLGEYYETEVMSRFEYILKEENNRRSKDLPAGSQGDMPLVLDIGGNIGFYTLLSAYYQHAVLTFEINPANIIRICESLHLNSANSHGWLDGSPSSSPRLGPIRMHQRGVSNVTGTRLQIRVPNNPGETSLQPNKRTSVASDKEDGSTATGRTFVTTTTTLDDFAQERNWFDRPDIVFSILKIDVEGHEPQILQGAQRFLKAHKVKNVLLEYRRHCRPFLNILINAGYGLVDNNNKLLNREETIAFADKTTKKMKYWDDLWFRLGTLDFEIEER